MRRTCPSHIPCYHFHSINNVMASLDAMKLVKVCSNVADGFSCLGFRSTSLGSSTKTFCWGPPPLMKTLRGLIDLLHVPMNQIEVEGGNPLSLAISKKHLRPLPFSWITSPSSIMSSGQTISCRVCHKVPPFTASKVMTYKCILLQFKTMYFHTNCVRMYPWYPLMTCIPSITQKIYSYMKHLHVGIPTLYPFHSWT